MKVKKIIIAIYLFLGIFFLPLYAYISIVAIYILIDKAYWSFRMNENLKGIACSLISILLLLFMYIMMLQETIEKALDLLFK